MNNVIHKAALLTTVFTFAYLGQDRPKTGRKWAQTTRNRKRRSNIDRRTETGDHERVIRRALLTTIFAFAYYGQDRAKTGRKWAQATRNRKRRP